jgi:plastocyanin
VVPTPTEAAPTPTTEPTPTEAAELEPTATPMPAPTELATTDETPAPAPEIPVRVTEAEPQDVVAIALNEQNDSGQNGIATLTAQGDDTEVVLSLSEGTMETSAVHIHNGQCGPGDLGGVVHPLTNITNGTSATLLEGVSLEGLRTGDFAINTHNADDPSVYTACGNIPASEAAPGAPPASSAVASDIANFTLENLTVPVGTTVTWTNQDVVPHTSTSGVPGTLTGIWDSPTLGEGDSFSFTFERSGTLSYFCRIHPDSMRATVTVVEP